MSDELENTSTVKLKMPIPEKSAPIFCTICGDMLGISQKKTDNKKTEKRYKLCKKCLAKDDKESEKLAHKEKGDLIAKKKNFGLKLKLDRIKAKKKKEGRRVEKISILKAPTVNEKFSTVEKALMKDFKSKKKK